jgi:hypothetical protein
MKNRNQLKWKWVTVSVGLALIAGAAASADIVGLPQTYTFCAGNYRTWSDQQQACVCVAPALPDPNGIDCYLPPGGPGGGGTGTGGAGGGTGGQSGGNGNGGMGGTGGTGGMSGTGGTGGSGGVDCSQCPQPGLGSQILISNPPPQCSSQICIGICDAKAEADHFGCVVRANAMESQCDTNMSGILGRYCTNTIPAETGGDVDFWDLNSWATAVCTNGSYDTDPVWGWVINANANCKNAVASAINGQKRSECRDDLMNGSGSYFDSSQLTVKIGAGDQSASYTIGKGGGGTASGMGGVSGYGACAAQTKKYSDKCDDTEQCEQSKCHGQTTGCPSGTTVNGGSGSK